MSQGAEILTALQSGRVLTTLDIFKLCGSMAGHSRINDLRRQGYDIECKLRMRGSRKVWEYTLLGQLELAERTVDQIPGWV